MTGEQFLIQMFTQALKDITNASGNGHPYSTEELIRIFGADYEAGREYLENHDLKEIA